MTLRRVLRPGGLLVAGTLDRYVARLFCLSYLVAFLLVVGLFLIIDMATNLDDYLAPGEGAPPPSSLVVGRYYALQLPFLYLQVSPYVTLVAGLFTGAKLNRYREIIAALGAGISARRLVGPVFAAAAMLSVAMFALREWATDALGAERDALLDRIEERREDPVYERFGWWDGDGRRFDVGEYRRRGRGGVAQIRDLEIVYRRGERTLKFAASRAEPLPGGRWRLEDGRRLEAIRGALMQAPVHIDVLEEVRFSPSDVELAWKAQERPIDLSFSELERLLERAPTSEAYRTLLHHHVTFPLAGLVLLAVGLPFVLRQQRGRGGERVAKGFFLCMAYFGVEFVARTLGLQGQLGPLFAAWLPVLGFGALGVVLLASLRS